jgi:hypothetical protein
VKVIQVVLISTLLFSTDVFAKCDKYSKKIFSCTLENNSRVEVCDAGKTMEFKFSEGQERLKTLVKSPREQVTKWERPVATYHNFAINIFSDSIHYRVFWNVDLTNEETFTGLSGEFLIGNHDDNEHDKVIHCQRKSIYLGDDWPHDLNDQPIF